MNPSFEKVKFILDDFGIPVEIFTPDGKLHSFNNDSYYVAFQNFSSTTGEPFYFAFYGLITAEMQEYCTLENLSVLDQGVYKKRKKEAEKLISQFSPQPEREPIDEEKHYIACLGYDSGDYFFISNINPQIQRLSSGQLNSNGLCRLQPLAYWETMYPAKPHGIGWSRAADDLMQRCHSVGIFRTDKVRGRGVWIDRDRVVYHRGTVLSVGETEFPLHRNGLESKYIYELSEQMPPLHPKPLTVDECLPLIHVADSLRWKRRESALFLTGWIAIAPLGGALAWRPHVWVTGPSSSGKSYIVEHIARPILEHYSHYFLGSTSEAGVRQTIGCSTIPVIFDEFETDDDKSSARVRSVVELARQASSRSDGIVAKGTVSGDAMQFRPQFCMMASSIRPNLIHEQDENRHTLLEILRGEDDEERVKQFDHVKMLTNQVLGDFGERLFSRMFGLAKETLESAETIQNVIAERNPMRVGQQYGALLAGYWMLISDYAITKEQARELIDGIDFGAQRNDSDRKDEEECFSHLLSKKVTLQLSADDRREYSMAEALREAMLSSPDGPKINHALQRIGIKITLEKDIAIAGAGHSELEAVIYRGSKWSKSWQSSLNRLPGARSATVRLTGNVLKGVLLPGALLKSASV
jgi:putative DNA primase/helicase